MVDDASNKISFLFKCFLMVYYLDWDNFSQKSPSQFRKILEKFNVDLLRSSYLFFNPIFMRSLNRVMLIGHLAADVEMRQTKNGHTVVNFPLATNYIAKNEDGSKRELTDFHRVIAWNGFGQMCGQYLKKGMAVYLEGRLLNRSFDDKEGKRHYKTEVVAEDLNILTWKKVKTGQEVGIEAMPGVEEREEELVAA